ncbi:MAG: sulfatase [Bacteroidales bacterium]
MNTSRKKLICLISYQICSVGAVISGNPDTKIIPERGASGRTDNPNIIVLLTDDQGYGDAGCYKNTHLTTPNLDQMAKEGIRFTQFYAGASSSTPSRAALLTGRYAERLKLSAVVDDTSLHGIPADEYTVADFLKQNNYATAIFGKWHLGWQAQFMPNQHGFTTFFGIPYSADMWLFHPSPAHSYRALPVYENEQVTEYNPNVNNMTTRLTERAVEFVEKHRNEPFFMYVAYTQPHVPLGVSSKFRGRSGQGLYADVIMELDWSVGEILKTLDKTGLSENTLVIFTSDNGPWLTYGNHAGSNGGLREGKGTTFEGGQRVPCIARMPGSIPAGTVSNQWISALDIMPTILKVTNTIPLKMNPLDGENVWDAFEGKDIPHRPFFYVNNTRVEAIRDGKWKLIVPHKYRIVTEAGKDGKPGKQENKGGDIGLSLFNVEKDLKETQDVSSLYPDIVMNLSLKIDSLQRIIDNI